MKKITLSALLLLTFVPKAVSQCNEVSLPYHENFDTAILPDLPDCTYSYRQTFVGSEWETIASPNSNFTGNVARYVTTSDVGWGMSCYYIIRPAQFTAGMAYKVHYKYGHDSNEGSIEVLRSGIYPAIAGSGIELATHEAITGTDAVNYASELFTVPSTGSYYLRFEIETSGNQGILYLDDIKIEEMGTMGTETSEMEHLAYYPNPVTDKLTVSNNLPVEKLELYNTTGQLLQTQFPTQETATLSFEHLPTGIYFLKANAHGASKTMQIIRQ